MTASEWSVWRHAAYFLLLVAVLVLALGATWNPVVWAPDGQTYEQHLAEGEAFIAETRAYAIAHCGEAYMPSCEGWR